MAEKKKIPEEKKEKKVLYIYLGAETYVAGMVLRNNSIYENTIYDKVLKEEQVLATSFMTLEEFSKSKKKLKDKKITKFYIKKEEKTVKEGGK